METSLCQAAIHTYETAMVFLRRAPGAQSHILTYMLTLMCVFIVLLLIFGGGGV